MESTDLPCARNAVLVQQLTHMSKHAKECKSHHGLPCNCLELYEANREAIELSGPTMDLIKAARQRLYNEGFAAGSASRDALIAELKDKLAIAGGLHMTHHEKALRKISAAIADKASQLRALGVPWSRIEIMPAPFTMKDLAGIALVALALSAPCETSGEDAERDANKLSSELKLRLPLGWNDPQH